MTNSLSEELSVSAPGTLLGTQEPRILYSPEGITDAGDDAIDLAEAFGLVLDPWQRLVLREALKEREDGTWAASEVGLMVSRQNGKGSILEAVELYGLLLGGERLILHTAHEFKTAKEAMRRLAQLLEAHGAEHGVKYKTSSTNGLEGIEIIGGSNSGARVMFQTRTKGAGLGLTADRVICDEAMIISPESIQALMFTTSARPNTQIWYTGSAVDQRIHIGCEVFGSARARALKGIGTRLCYIEFSADEKADPTKIETALQANPAAGRRISIEDIQTECDMFGAMDNMRAYGVQRLGIGDWPALGETRSEIPKDKWLTFKNLEPELVGPNVVALYRAPEGGPWAIAAAQRVADGRIHLEVGYAGNDPADRVAERFIQVAAAWGSKATVIGRGAADAASTRLAAAGLDPDVPNLADEAQACGGLLDDVFAETPALSHGNRANLNTAMASAVKRELPSGGFVWEMVSENTYPLLMGVTLARWALLKYSNAGPEPTIYDWPDQAEIDSWLTEEEDF